MQLPHVSQQTIASARKSLAERLSAFLAKTEAVAESWRWFEEGLGWNKARVIAHGGTLVPLDIEDKLKSWIDRREIGEPWAYILGWSFWRGRQFIVSPETLIPRPETEHVFEAALELAKLNEAKKIVDIGTGSGILAITLALETSLDVVGTDISAEALKIAEQNAKNHNVSVSWQCGDLLDAVPDPIDLVVSNPPYVNYADKALLQREILFEPHDALFAFDNGLRVINKLLEQCINRNAKVVVVEIGSGQGDELRTKALALGWQSVDIMQDMAGHDRVLVANRTGH